jgi:hypothetical protein
LRKSIDKRRDLNIREFGYRSVHLICSARGSQLIRYPDLRGRVFEVQVRSLLEHSWAETEHEVVYKAGVRFPLPMKRRFSSLAATLEVVDETYIDLRQRERQMAVSYAKVYSGGADLDENFDAARLAGFIEGTNPLRPGWRNGVAPQTYAPKIAATLVAALQSVGIQTGRALQASLQGAQCRRAIKRYAGASGSTPGHVSHLAALLIVIGLVDREALELYFPEESQDPDLARALS